MLHVVVAPREAQASETPAEEVRESGTARLLAQRRAGGTRRRHFIRALRRVSILLSADVAVLLTARTGLQLLRETSSLAPMVSSIFPEGFMGGMGSVAAVIVGLTVAGAYSSEQRWAYPATVLRGVAYGAALALWQSIDARGIAETGLRWTLVVALLGAVFVVARRLLWLAVERRRQVAKPTDRVLLVGDPDTINGAKVIEAVTSRLGMTSVGWLCARGTVDDYLGHPSAVWEVLCETGTDTVLLCGDIEPAMFDAVVEAAAVAGCRVLSVPSSHFPLISSRPKALGVGSVRLLELTFPAARAGQDAVKRFFDIIGAAALLVVLSPLLLVVAAWIKLDSPGPVFFIQERVGQAGRIFPMWKFRSMEDGADEMKADLEDLNESGDPRLFKIAKDPRVTRSGAFLRRWSLDELPQLWNVLRGEMSLVGPRPFFESDLAAYDDHHFIRLTVKPGLTGLWQVKGRSSIIDFEQVVSLDREYVENWTLGLDLAILLATLPAVIRRTGAY